MLDSLFTPTSIAVIGASRTPGKLGYAILGNIIESKFAGPIYPINATPPNPGETDDIMGYPVYPSLAAVPGPIGLAVIVLPAKAVMPSLEDCAAHRVGAVIVISAGFRETGGEGFKLERHMATLAEKHHKMKDYKKLVMADPVKVVDKAILDSRRKKAVSIYSLPMQLFAIAVKIIPHGIILRFWQGED